MADNVLVREVGLRDGLQMIGTFVATADKKEWIDRCMAAGFRELEVSSFVPEKYLPQFRDASDVTAYCSGKPEFVAAVFVPNLQGAQRALAAGADKLVCPLSATEAFSAANLRRSKARSMEELKQIVQLRDRMASDAFRARIQAGISVSFGCPFEGRIADRDVCDLAVAAADAGVDEIALADTAGHANPAQVRRVFGVLNSELPKFRVGAHFHDTRGTGLANVVAALDAGVRMFDATISGLGGCPHSPGATGNIVTEDLIFMLEAMGLDTGVDLQQLLAIRAFLAPRLPGVRMFGHVSKVDLPKGFMTAKEMSKAAERAS